MAYVKKTNIETKPKQPKALAVLKGTYQKCRHEDQIQESMELDFVFNTLPNAPIEVGEFGSKYWQQTLGQAQKVFGYISFLDLGMFTELCKVYNDMRILESQFNGQPYIMKDANGKPIQNPIYVALKEARADFGKLSRDFGFTPVARTRIKLEQQKQQIETETFEL